MLLDLLKMPCSWYSKL